MFVDATYEGDLLKAAGVSYAIGREGRGKYHESFAGRQELLPAIINFAYRLPLLMAMALWFPTFTRSRISCPSARATEK